jgi:hypothetical protein
LRLCDYSRGSKIRTTNKLEMIANTKKNRNKKKVQYSLMISILAEFFFRMYTILITTDWWLIFIDLWVTSEKEDRHYVRMISLGYKTIFCSFLFGAKSRALIQFQKQITNSIRSKTNFFSWHPFAYSYRGNSEWYLTFILCCNLFSTSFLLSNMEEQQKIYDNSNKTVTLVLTSLKNFYS